MNSIRSRRLAAHFHLKQRLDVQAGNFPAGSAEQLVIRCQVEALPAAGDADAERVGENLAIERGIAVGGAELLAEGQVGEEQRHAAGLDIQPTGVALLDIDILHMAQVGAGDGHGGGIAVDADQAGRRDIGVRLRQQGAAAADGIADDVVVGGRGGEGQGCGDLRRQAAGTLLLALIAFGRVVGRAVGQGEIERRVDAEHPEGRTGVAAGQAGAPRRHLPAQPSADVVAVEMGAIGGDHQAAAADAAQQFGQQVELLVGDLVAAIDRAAVDLLGNAQGLQTLGLRDMGQEQQIVVALAQGQHLGAPGDQAAELHLLDQETRQTRRAAQQPGLCLARRQFRPGWRLAGLAGGGFVGGFRAAAHGGGI